MGGENLVTFFVKCTERCVRHGLLFETSPLYAGWAIDGRDIRTVLLGQKIITGKLSSGGVRESKILKFSSNRINNLNTLNDIEFYKLRVMWAE